MVIDPKEETMVDYGLKNKVAIITGANNPWGIGAITALAFAREGAKVVLVYKKIDRPFDATKTDRHGADRYYGANAGDASAVEAKLKDMNADYLIIESDISNEDCVKKIYVETLKMYGNVDILVNNAADGDMDGIDTIEKITQKVIDDTFAVNVRGSIMMTREFVPKHIIELIPKTSKVYVACSTTCRGKEVINACSVGCIGCGLCAKNFLPEPKVTDTPASAETSWVALVSSSRRMLERF